MNVKRNRLAFLAITWSTVLLPVSLALLISLASGCTSNRPPQDAVADEQRPAHQTVSSTNQSASSPVSSNPADAKLTLEIDRLIDSSEFASARWGVFVTSLRDGRTVYGRNADKLFTPASNMKLYPTGIALDLLGRDYRWRTSVYATEQPDANGAINDLILYGRGAPDLFGRSKNGSSSLVQLAEDLYNRGLRRVKGNVIGDESYFRGEPLGDGWQWNDIQWYFGAEASALSINNNEVDVTILPPDKSGAPPVVRVSDSDGHVTVENGMAAVERSERMTVGIQRGLSDNVVRVWGTFPAGSKGFGARLSVHNPALWAARLFSEALKARGIVVEGSAQTRNSRKPLSERFDPSKAIELTFLSSQPLSEIVKTTNKESFNLHAELILRTLGRERGAMVSEPDPAGRERGDDEAGLAVIRLWLDRAGVSTEGLAFHDGSGLSRLNLVTPASICGLLSSLSTTASAQIFRESLPLSGRDGTLGGRLSAITDRVSGKTGALIYDTSLSGYVTTANGETLAFSIICNDKTSRPSSTRLIDHIVLTLAGFPPEETKNSLN